MANLDIFDDKDMEERIKNSVFQNNYNLNDDLFITKPASTWIKEASEKPIPRMLFDAFFFEGEVCILFSDTNLGKSILAVQIGNAISSNKPISGFRLEGGGQKVMYFDFELTDKQFETRYTDNYTNPFLFSQQFLRSEINTDFDLPNGSSFEDVLIPKLESQIIAQQAKVIIIDNLTYLRDETEKAKDALPLMKELKRLKNQHGLSLLVLAHTPKRDLSKPLSVNDLQGSKMLSNFCDSIFAIGAGLGQKGIRYLKQIKQRNCEQIYDANNVCICQITKPSNFLGFEFQRYGCESEFLKAESDSKGKHSQWNEIIELHKEGKSYEEIRKQLDIGHKQEVGRVIKRYEKEQAELKDL